MGGIGAIGGRLQFCHPHIESVQPHRATTLGGIHETSSQAEAYGEMEPHLCDVVRMGEIAASLFDCTDQGLFVFAVTHLEDMLLKLRRRYYASDFAS
jgi:hypothetical protein